MTRYEIKAMQFALASAHDIMVAMCANENEAHDKKVKPVFQVMIDDLESMVDILIEIDEGGHPIEFGEDGNEESNDESPC